MGSRMAEKLLKEGHSLTVWNRSSEPREQLKEKFPKAKNLVVAENVRELVKSLPNPRVVLIMLPAGEVSENVLSDLAKLVDKQDIVIDAGNAYYQDTERHYQEFTKKGIRFLGIGFSGGIIALKDGYPQMVGGDKSAYEYIKPVLDSLAKPHGGHEYFGTGGAGHFVKMVHNGIEYPIMQAIGEGFGLLENSKYNIDLLKVAKLYQKGTLVSGFMMDRTVEALENDPGLSTIQGTIGSASPQEIIGVLDEGNKYNLPVESIQQARDFRVRSETDRHIQDSFAAKMVGALRIAFGGHPVKRKE
jgi:6-phosphogluconate dehydrogenase